MAKELSIRFRVSNQWSLQRKLFVNLMRGEDVLCKQIPKFLAVDKQPLSGNLPCDFLMW